jgi:ankyrin repeat protein
MQYGWSILMEAANNGHLSVVSKLLSAGADKAHKDPHGWNAVMAAADNGYAIVLEKLLHAGVPADGVDVVSDMHVSLSIYIDMHVVTAGRRHVVRRMRCGGRTEWKQRLHFRELKICN